MQFKTRKCKVCGCTDDNCIQCIGKTGLPCHWVGPELCSACGWANEHPIIFSPPMVLAIIQGRKTMTRRIIKPQPRKDGFMYIEDSKNCGITDNQSNDTICPYGKVGDILWVREKFCNISKPQYKPEYVFYVDSDGAEDFDPTEWKWKPSIHMPRAVARIFLEITNIRVERLRDITKEDAIAEGIDTVDVNFYRNYNTIIDNPKNGSGYVGPYSDPTYSFFSLWDSIHTERPSYKDPWVWVIEFRRIEK